MTNLIWHASRHRLLGDDDSGAQAVALLQGAELAHRMDVVTMATALGYLHAYEMVCEHASWAGQSGAWLDGMRSWLEGGFGIAVSHPVEAYWRVALRLGGAVVLEDDGAFHQGVSDFRGLVDAQIHAEGYLKDIVTLDGGASFQHQQEAMKALVLGAEIARQAGEDLWQYEQRGVSVTTGVAYQVYYYFFPDKWRWAEVSPYDEAFMHESFSHGGAYIEIATQRNRPRNVEFMLEERRPFFDALGGGFTTLTHGIGGEADKPRRRGWFG